MHSDLTSQSIQSLLSSSIGEEILGLYKLSSKDAKRLDKIYEKLSKTIIERRSQKIKLLERYDSLLS